ncbi:hypothetical protein SAMN02745126_06379 [Enhydrobacter aerosaccus]|uniref:Uncharacterized protein n=1 Tax=Enhydrobacter aerosaccus TaxID=225324 RepID=A0A1T4TJD9_9HYPH|nr:hypothetical protein [Enhydrobacter aerosaccus]SKA40565.1 hypothetical protein SAMN02745126_06379 [Enhydrobacter aerosaccus]
MTSYRFASLSTAVAAVHHLGVAAQVYEPDAKETAHLRRTTAEFQRMAAEAKEIAEDIERQVF